MNHRPAPLLWCGSRLARQIAARAAAAMLCATLFACGDARATLVILSDSTAASASRVVVALPFDPAALPIVAAAPLPDGPRGDSVRLAIARHDSAARADVDFQRARTSANDAARALATLDRTTDSYAERYSAWTALADSATLLRTIRDSLRQRLRGLTVALGPAAPDLDRSAPRTRTRASADSAARDLGLELVEASLRGNSSMVSVPAGIWWIAATTPDGELIVPANRVEVASGGTDTVVVPITVDAFVR